MNNDSSVELTSIKWVLRELAPMLNDVQQAIVSYVEAPEYVTSMEGVVGMLRKIHGTVQMLELYGAEMLAEEMERMVEDLHGEKLKNREEALDVLMRAALQLPDYLDRIRAGSADVPLVLLPLLNDLRAARGEALLSESVLFVPNLLALDAGSITREEEEDLTGVVRGLRLPFMRALLDWIKDDEDIRSLGRMSQVFYDIENAAHSQSSRKIWSICRAVVDSLYDKGLSAGASIKLLLAQVERSLKHLLECGEMEFVRSLPTDLFKNLLYYVARSTSESPLVTEIRREYRLDELLPSQEQLEEARRTHQGPSIELLQVANQGVRDDVSEIKDLVEGYVHAEDRKLSMLDPLDGLLRRVCDTLSVLGIGEPRGLLDPKQKEIRDFLNRKEDPGDDRLFEIAAVLLKVEDMLDRHVTEQTNLIKPEPAQVSGTADILSLKDLPEREYQALVQSVIKESLRTFARTREAFVDYSTQSDNAHHIKQIPGLLNEVIGAFKIMSNSLVLPLLSDLSAFIESRYLVGGVIPDQFEQELIADATTCIEYYLESIPEDEDEREREYILDVSRSALDQLMSLGDIEPVLHDEQVAADETRETEIVDLTDLDPEDATADGTLPRVIDLENNLAGPADSTTQIDVLNEIDMEHDETIQLDSPDLHDIDEDTDSRRQQDRVDQAQATDDAGAATATSVGELSAQTSPQIIGEDVDEEILEVFIEEALDEVGAINEYLPKWKADTDDEESLGRVRRSFHTLKGSGRLVGAEHIGDYAWCNENLLNYVLRGDLHPGDSLFSLLEESVAVLPQLIAQLQGEGNSVEIDELVGSINALIDEAINPRTGSRESAVPTLDDIEREPSPEDIEPESTVDPLDISVVDVEEFDAGDFDDLVAFDIDELDITVGEYADEKAVEVPEDVPTEQPETSDNKVDHGIDPVLMDIFSKESLVHLETLEKIFQQSSELSGIIQPNDPLIRALHTLHGSAQTAQVGQIAQLAGPFEKVAKHKRELGLVFDIEESRLLKEAIDSVSDTLDALLNSSEIPEHVDRLVERVVGYADHARAESGPVEADQGDIELQNIFIEEAGELVNAAEQIVGQWRESPQDFQLVSDIKRQLHTLKGGARMAGYAPVADLTHALESSIIAHEAVGEAPPESYFDLLQETVDALAVNVEQARSGQDIGHFDWIVSDLQKDTAKLSQTGPAVESVSAGQKLHADSLGGEATEPGPPAAPSMPTIEELASRRATPDEEGERERESKRPESTDAVSPALEQSVPTPPPDASSTGSATAEQTASNILPLKMTAHAIEEALKEHTAPTAVSPARGAEDKSQEQIRVRSELLDNLVTNAGEVNIYHARFGQQIGDMSFSLNELDQTVARLREQLRLMDRETEAQILYGYDQIGDQTNREFDPLELDRYSHIQELSRSLLESVADLEDIKGTLGNLTRDSETLLLQQSRVSTELQEGLLRTRMVRFDGVEPRLSRIVRQTAQSLKKKASLTISGGENEVDRGVQERMIAPLEHILRNSVAHGIELPDARQKVDKPATGKVAIRLSLDGGDILIRVIDDGAGIDVEAVRQTAVERNLIDADDELHDQEVLHLLFESGFSTVNEVTQIAGRGIGLDVVGREIKQLGGSLTLESEQGIGTMFVIRLPQTLAISQSLLVESAGETYAVPINGIRGVNRVSVAELSAYYRDPEKQYAYAGEDYRVIHLTTLLQVQSSVRQPTEQVPLIMVRSGEEMAAVQVDELIGRREIVIKPAGAQIGMVSGITGAALLGDGTVVLVLDIGGLLQTLERGNIARELSILDAEQAPSTPVAVTESPRPTLTVLVVDDSITIRKVTARMLERHNMTVVTAKDGVDAVSQLREQKPDLMLLDIEMPRMDGFEVAGFVRSDTRLKDLPIIVITSRTGEKHRQRARDLGVDKYLGKPYQELELIRMISEVLGKDFSSQ